MNSRVSLTGEGFDPRRWTQGIGPVGDGDPAAVAIEGIVRLSTPARVTVRIGGDTFETRSVLVDRQVGDGPRETGARLAAGLHALGLEVEQTGGDDAKRNVIRVVVATHTEGTR